MISVCLVDDQTLVRQGIRSLLELSDSIRVVAEAADGAQAVKVIAEVAPDVVLLDMRMPGMSGLDVLNALGGSDQRPPPIILTTSMTSNWCWPDSRPGSRLSAQGRFPRPAGGRRQCLRRWRNAGGAMVTQRLLSGLERMQNDFTSLDRPDPLTERETEILRLMAGGYSNKEIASSLWCGRRHGEKPCVQHSVETWRPGSYARGTQGFRARYRLALPSLGRFSPPRTGWAQVIAIAPRSQVPCPV